MLIILILWTIGIFAVSHYLKHRRYHKSDVKFFRIYSGVHDLAQIVNQLQELEELQTQIELARFHHLKGVQRHTGKENQGTCQEWNYSAQT